MPRLPHKTTQFLWATVKILIVALAGYFIYSKLKEANFNILEYTFEQQNTVWSYWTIAVIILFSIFNWLFEIKKWQLLIRPVKSVTFIESTRQTLVAHLLGFITPAKTGDYGAKALFFESVQRKKILFLNFLGNMYQMLFTLFFGLIGLGILAFFTSGTAIFFWLMAVMLCVLFYFILPRFLSRIHWSLKGNSWHKVRTYFRTIPKQTRKNARLLAFGRYLIFAHQFYFLIIFLGATLSYPFAMACIGAMYLISSFVPVMQLFDVVVRGGVAVLIFGWYNVPEEIVLATVLIMWLLNVVVPLVFGSYFLLSRKSNFPQKSSVKKNLV